MPSTRPTTTGYGAMVSVFSAVLSAADPATGETIDGGTVAWSVSGGRGR